jgi:two-component system cell cycle response regulator CpdR
MNFYHYDMNIGRYSKLCLIVDDQEPIRMFVGSILQREKFETVGAENGQEALRHLESLGTAVQLIVTDIKMPNGDGLELAAAARRLFPFLPVVLISGDAERQRFQYRDSDYEFLQKPFLGGTLLASVQKAERMMEIKKLKSDEATTP